MSEVADRRLYDQVVEILEKVRAHEPEAPLVFNAEQVSALKAMAEVWMGLQTMGHIAKWAQGVLKYIGWAASAYVLYKAWTAGWFRG